MSASAALVLLVAAVACVAAVRCPFVGLLAYLCLDFMRPTDFFVDARVYRPMLVVATTVLGAAAWRRRHRLLDDWTLYLPLAVLVGAAGMAAIAGDSPGSAAGVIQAIKMLLLVWLISVLITGREQFNAALWIVCLSLLVHAGGVILQAVDSGLMREFHIGRVVRGPDGPFGDNNNIARVLAMSVPLWWILAVTERIIAFRIAAVAALVVTVIAIEFTFSRSGFVSLAVAVSVLSLSYRPLRRALLIPVLFVLALVILSPSPYRERILTIARPARDASMQGRFEIWKGGLERVKKNPLVGQGPGSFEGAGKKHRSSHNIFVEVLTEMGVIGLTAYLWVLFAAFRALYHLRLPAEDAERDGWLRMASFGLASALAAYLTAGLALSAPLLSPLFVLVGLTFALCRLAPGAPRGLRTAPRALRRRGRRGTRRVC